MAKGGTAAPLSQQATALANKLARIAWSVLRHYVAFDGHRHEVVVI
ncbi:MAG: hypothetical protein HC869_13310 [Rhodospirillales bacterium]|nr:hypothetical protein [Rhodospirillales bacterium]